MTAPTPELSVVLPAYEEAANLEWLLPELRRVLDGLGTSYEIVVIDAPEPRDATPQICARHGVICQARQGGALYGHAIRTAQRIIRGRYVVIMDADGSHSPELLPRLWECRDRADIVIASRYVRGGRTENPAILIFMSFVVNCSFRVFLGLKCADVSNSYRLYRGDRLRALALECDNFDIVEEILVKLYFARSGCVLKEVPFTFEKRKAGRTKRQLVVFALGYSFTLWRLHRLKARMRAHQGKAGP